jgi:ribosomal protein S18 acetylase RimI-like enzyme
MMATRPGSRRGAYDHRLKRMRNQGMKPPLSPREGDAAADRPRENAAIDCGWGRLLFGQTFGDAETLAEAMRAEKRERRDIAFYVRDPHLILAAAPQELFLDPSHTYRLDLATYRASRRKPRGFFVRRLASEEDAEAVNRIYAQHHMVPVPPNFFWSNRDSRALTYLVAEDEVTGDVIGTVTGVSHFRAFNDPERGSSLWCLAVDPQAGQPGIGEALVRRLAEHMKARRAAYLDLSVLHDNETAIALYEKLGFRRVPYFAVKRKNPINEPLFAGPAPDDRAQPLCPDHRQRGAAPGRAGGDHRCRRRLLPPVLWRAQHSLPRGPDRPDEFRRHVDVRRQGGHPTPHAAGGAYGGGAARNRGCARDRAVPGRAWVAGDQAGARRAGARRRGGRRNAGRGRGRGGERPGRSATGCWWRPAGRATTCGSSSSASNWWRRPSAGRPMSPATAGRRCAN